MTTRTTPPSSQGYRFPDSKVVRYIETLRKIQFSGQLIWIAPGDEKKWSFYLYSGRIFYATGGTHPVRRWARNLATYCPQNSAKYYTTATRSSQNFSG
ncbi:MAG: hypothetical protein HC865_24840 [Cyanobacteria bacterium RU_5_0]|nr:hypothetical protein [Cyanobacteria bacterium RU_5_0]